MPPPRSARPGCATPWWGYRIRWWSRATATSRAGLGAEALAGSGITAIACYNDLTAIGALRALRGAGMRVPQDMSVFGFDDIEMAAWTDPPLTTIRQPTGELGRWAVERLIGSLDGTGSNGSEPRELEPELVVRASTEVPPG